MPEPSDRHYMRLALIEGRKGRGRTSPNPCVGAVVVNNHRVVGKGYHKKAGAPHAEVMALDQAGELARGAELYVTLEPCNHSGRTPPCTRRILASGIRRVVIGVSDPNPRVIGGGADYLRSNGISVDEGVLEEQCRELIRPFIKYITTSLPFIAMKAGLTLDGKISLKRGRRATITGPESHRFVHRLRDHYDALVVGIGTVIADDPLLTTRIPGKRGNDPVRVILDTHLRIDEDARVLHADSAAATWIFCGPDCASAKADRLRSEKVKVFSVACGRDGKLDLDRIVSLLAAENIMSVLVEGGARVHGEFVKRQLVDRVYLFYAPIFGGTGGNSVIECDEPFSSSLRITHSKSRRYGSDVLIEGDVYYGDIET
jgi:diaminohydroxyphosphoribosylaminopyrimidine deaminase/5-amino-6-(5-phosphoribosylamino)uracil reductase